jgi:hypothetical protein
MGSELSIVHILGFVDVGGTVDSLASTKSLFFFIEFAFFFGFDNASFFSLVSFIDFLAGATSSFLLFFYLELKFLALFVHFFFSIFSLHFKVKSTAKVPPNYEGFC